MVGLEPIPLEARHDGHSGRGPPTDEQCSCEGLRTAELARPPVVDWIRRQQPRQQPRRSSLYSPCSPHFPGVRVQGWDVPPQKEPLTLAVKLGLTTSLARTNPKPFVLSIEWLGCLARSRIHDSYAHGCMHMGVWCACKRITAAKFCSICIRGGPGGAVHEIHILMRTSLESCNHNLLNRVICMQPQWR